MLGHFERPVESSLDHLERLDTRLVSTAFLADIKQSCYQSAPCSQTQTLTTLWCRKLPTCTRPIASDTRGQRGNGRGNTLSRCVADTIEEVERHFIDDLEPWVRMTNVAFDSSDKGSRNVEIELDQKVQGKEGRKCQHTVGGCFTISFVCGRCQHISLQA